MVVAGASSLSTVDLDVDRWPTDLIDRVGRPEREVSMEEEAFRAIGNRFCLSTT